MPLQNVKITDPAGVHIDGKLRKEGEVVPVDGKTAGLFASSGRGEVVPGDAATPTDRPLREVVEPVVPNADPMHAARLGSLAVEDHPGLQAAADAGVPGAPKRAGRVVPESDVVTTTPADPAKQAKPGK